MKYDPQADALAIRFTRAKDARPVTRVLAGNIRGDYVGEQLVAIEILAASQLIDPRSLATIAPAGTWLTIEEAVKVSKRQPTTLRNAIAHSRLKAEKRGRDWMVLESELLNYLESLSPAGRKPANRSASHRNRSSTAKAAR
ncbi:MAG: DUF2283 domain-containing protein [Gemmatimonadaceae bacterium]